MIRLSFSLASAVFLTLSMSSAASAGPKPSMKSTPVSAVVKACDNMNARGEKCSYGVDSNGNLSGCTDNTCFHCTDGKCVGTQQ